jgi:hypothetical protein
MAGPAFSALGRASFHVGTPYLHPPPRSHASLPLMTQFKEFGGTIYKTHLKQFAAFQKIVTYLEARF